jgi:multidrug efflux pump subunit AcrA (membrane-fusion protein)
MSTYGDSRSSGHQPGKGMVKVLVSVLVSTALVLGIVISWGIHSRVEAETQLQIMTNQAAIPSVELTHPRAGAPAEEIVLPGTTQAFTDTPIYARTNGYLKAWCFDIGARVKKGQLLAEIDTPELDQQLQQARADYATAQANLQLAKTTADRWQFLVQSGSVSKQETDQAVSNLAATKAAADASAANVRRLEELQSFEKIYAPFDGVITQRNTDFGDLIDAGASDRLQPGPEGSGSSLWRSSSPCSLQSGRGIPHPLRGPQRQLCEGFQRHPGLSHNRVEKGDGRLRSPLRSFL